VIAYFFCSRFIAMLFFIGSASEGARKILVTATAQTADAIRCPTPAATN
jgi:hypothetical protein